MKRIIQIVSFLALAFVFGSVGANAQQVTRIDANVPFDFVIGDKYFSAGEYTIRVNSTAAGARQLEVRWKTGEIVHNALIVPNGDAGRGRAELVFDRSSGMAVLTKIITEDAGYRVPTVDLSRLAAKQR